MTKASVVLAEWQGKTTNTALSVVLPDGCQDLILHIKSGHKPEWFVSKLTNSSYIVESSAEEWFTGYRLHPGAIIDTTGLLDSVSHKSSFDKADILTALNNFVIYDKNVTEALSCISEHNFIQHSARQLGVSERTLERLKMKYTKRSPGFWKALARVRRAAKFVANTDIPLIDIAYLSGYAGQAHLTRDFQRWFNVSPALFRHSFMWH